MKIVFHEWYPYLLYEIVEWNKRKQQCQHLADAAIVYNIVEEVPTCG
jgi:hypothetical protein